LCRDSGGLHSVARYLADPSCDNDLPLAERISSYWCGAVPTSMTALVGFPSEDLDGSAESPIYAWLVGSGEEGPLDPFMIPSVAPRPPVPHPRTGEVPLTVAEAQELGSFTLNGHEHSLAAGLQLACRAFLESPRPCDEVVGPCICANGQRG
ncbi:MAG: hypothetical protein JW751_27085, partial [Polyangiaceae bacterium]|nr:hypothetical protein [Polyangiaceae bacterium]